MTNLGTKKNVLIITLIGTLLILALVLLAVTDFCYNSKPCMSFFVNVRPWNLASYIFVTPFLFLLSLLTYRMHDDIFRVWWNFARWMVPIIIFATIAIQFVPSNGGFFNMDGLIYLLVLAPLYAILTLGSLWKIVRAYREMRKA